MVVSTLPAPVTRVPISAPLRPKVFIAGSWLRRSELRERAKQITACGADVCSTWLYKPVDPDYNYERYRTGETCFRSEISDQTASTMDIADVKRCDLLVLQSEAHGDYTTGGRLVEMGVALAEGKKVCVIGRAENIYGYAIGVKRFPDWEAFHFWLDDAIKEGKW